MLKYFEYVLYGSMVIRYCAASFRAGRQSPSAIVFGVVIRRYNHNVYSACVASCRLLQRQPLVFTIDVVILAYAARMGIVFIFQLEHHFASSVAGTFRQSVYTYGYFRLAVTAHWRQLTPVGLALHFPFAFGIQHQCLRVSVVQCAYRRRTAYQLMMGGNALEVAPSVPPDTGLWHFRALQA